MTNKNFKIAIIGIGKRGKTHIRNYQSLSGVEVVAVCDSNVRLLNRFNIPAYSNYKQMIDDCKIDGISICVPTRYHYNMARYCLMKDRHVLIEKPVTINVKEAQELQKISIKRNIVCMAGYSLRFDKNIKKIKDILDSGKVGKIIAVRGRQAHNWGGKRPFDWLVDKEISGGGTIIDNGSHFLDLFDNLFGPITEIGAIASNSAFNYSVEDASIISLRFASGLIGSIEMSWADARGRNNELIIWGMNAVIEYSESNKGTDLIITSYKSDNDEWNRLVREKLYIPKGIEQITKQSNIDNNKLLLAENTANMLNYFLTLLINSDIRKKFMSKNDLARSVILVHAAYKSLKRHKLISL